MDSDWILGKHAVQEAIQSGREIEKILLAEGLKKSSIQGMLQKINEKKIPFQWVPRMKLDRLSEGVNHQGVIAQVSATQYVSVEDLFERASKRGEKPCLIILDGVQDPHNLGSILRIAEATGAHGVIIPKRRAVGLTSVVAKVSAGAIEYVPIARVSSMSQTIDKLKEYGVWIVGADGGADQLYYQIDYDLPLAIVMGSEGEGISQLVRKKCDFLVKLPMLGQVSSLNVSTAAAVILYQVLRNRK